MRVAGLEVDVVYAKVSSSPDDVLQRLADGLVDRFVASGLMSRQYDRVKVHLTLLNSLFRTDTKAGIFDNEVKNFFPVICSFTNCRISAFQVSSKRGDGNGRGGGGGARRESLDARGILEEFGEREFVPELEVFVRKWTPKPIF